MIALVNTHWHLDHTTGNRDLLALWPKARLVATGAVSGALDGFPGAAAASNPDAALADPKLPQGRACPDRTRQRAAMDDQAALGSGPAGDPAMVRSRSALAASIFMSPMPPRPRPICG
ncbi:MAG: hypothetical protein R3E03_01555 [Novosphingobium sp.]